MEGCLSQHVRPILNKDTIDSVDDWRIFMRALSDNKVILLHEQRVVPEDILRYPMEAKEAERIILQSKANPNLVTLLFQIKYLQELMGNCATTVTVWRQMGMTEEQQTQLESIIGGIKDSVQGARLKLQEYLTSREGLDQSFIQAVERLEEMGAKQEPEPTAQQYQEDNYIRTEEHFQKIRVREVVERGKPVKSDPKAICVYTAFSKLDHKPVSVTRIPRTYNNYGHFQKMLTTIDAQHQLVFSPYFPKHYGYADTLQDTTFHYYFGSVVEGVSLKDILVRSKYHLEEDTPIYQFWCRHLLFAFRDLFTMSTYVPVLPVPIDRIYVDNQGLDLKIVGLEFARSSQSSKNRGMLQAKLLRNYGLLCLELLGISEQEIETVKKTNMRLMLKGLLRSQFQEARFVSGASKKRLYFSLILRMPQFSDQFIFDVNSDNLTRSFSKMLQG